MSFVQGIASNLNIKESLKNYSADDFKSDFIAGLTVAVIALPQSMAFALIAGLQPIYGLYTAIVSAILGAFIGTSSHVITGPTNVMAIAIASVVGGMQQGNDFFSMVLLLTFLVGVIQLSFGLLQLGNLVNFISHSVIVGFVAGAGVLIAGGQLNNILGIPLEGAYHGFLNATAATLSSLGEMHILSLLLGLFTIFVIILCNYLYPKLPGSLIAVIISIILTVLFDLNKAGVELVGYFPGRLPPFNFFPGEVNIAQAGILFNGAFAIAVIGVVEAVSIAKGIAASSLEKIDANIEFVRQGVVNMGAPFFNGFVGSASFTRSAINHQAGAKTRFSCFLAGLLLAVIVLLFAPFAQYIPIPTLAGIIMVAAYNMVDKEAVKEAFVTGTDSIVISVTFISTLILPRIEYAIYAGIFISIVLFLRKRSSIEMNFLTDSEKSDSPYAEVEDQEKLDQGKGNLPICIVQLEGDLFFGATSDLETKLEEAFEKHTVFVLRLKRVNTVDITAVRVLKQFVEKVIRSEGDIIFCGISQKMKEVFQNSGLISLVGRKNVFIESEDIFNSTQEAVDLAEDEAKNGIERNDEQSLSS